MSPQRVALNSLQTTRAAVEAAVKVFNTGYQSGQYGEIPRTQLKTLYSQYLAADTVAANLLTATTETNISAVIGDVTVAAGNVIAFVQSLKKVSP
jgi:hypothetical protein